MFSSLSQKQKEIVDCQESRIVVKACPGSGKTYSVSARLANLINNVKFQHYGVAVISFTRVAADEIHNSIRDNFGLNKLGYPHFIGTIDSFINRHIFLPFGHLILNCSKRPEIVGTEFNKWYDYDSSMTRKFKGRVVARDSNYYFDKVSFHVDGELRQLMPASSYHFSWKEQKKGNGDYKKVFQDIINSKWHHFSEGKANQADANYFALKLLQDYPFILKSLSNKYSHLIVDEAQDTTDIQMEIINMLANTGIKNIILVGDPNQAIFEWNTADADLFVNKFEDVDYFNIEIKENRRCSQNICNVLNTMIGEDTISVAEDKDYPNVPEIIGYSTNDDIQAIKDIFIQKCQDLNIDLEKSSIVYRGNKFGEEHFDLAEDNSFNHPWLPNHFYVRDIIHGMFLMDRGLYSDSLRVMEKGYFKFRNPDLRYVSAKYIRDQIEEKGYRAYRKELFDFINLLPNLGDKTLAVWIGEANNKLAEKGFNNLYINAAKASLIAKNIFHKNEVSQLPYNIGTIHSVKGQTFEAVLLFLKKDSATKHYANLLAANYQEADLSKQRKDKEELRLVYVACSRPKKLLWIAVPNDDVEIWRNHLGINQIDD